MSGGLQLFDVFSNKFSQDIFLQKYSKDGKETWAETCKRVVTAVCEGRLSKDTINKIYKYMVERKFIPGGRYLYAAGREFHQVNNCFLFRASDSREGWAEVMNQATMALMTGGGIGVDYSAVREEGATISRTGGKSTGPLALMQMVNEAGRHIMQGGARRSAIWAGLDWKHKDIKKFIHLKDHSPELKAAKQKDFNFALPMELTNISVIYGTDFFKAMSRNFDQGEGAAALEDYKAAKAVWLENCRQAFSTAEPGMAFNYLKDRESLRNACTEVTSENDGDKCNLGTIWLNNVTDITEFSDIVNCAVAFLLAGGIYSHLPSAKIATVGEINNRIGLGIGGLHEWLMQRGYDYEVVKELRSWLEIYEEESDLAAYEWSRRLNVAEPKGKRAIAPTGSIGILAESTTGIEPLFCKAYKRRYYKDGQWYSQYVVDGTVKNLIAGGVKMEAIKDAYEIGFEQRIKFQADVQDFVDMSISSTCNMAPWGSENNNESTVETNAAILLKYAKRLRGFTVYPDGCRGGQPLSRVSIEEALKGEGQATVEMSDSCDLTKSGSCGA